MFLKLKPYLIGVTLGIALLPMKLFDFSLFSEFLIIVSIAALYMLYLVGLPTDSKEILSGFLLTLLAVLVSGVLLFVQYLFFDHQWHQVLTFQKVSLAIQLCLLVPAILLAYTFTNAVVWSIKSAYIRFQGKT